MDAKALGVLLVDRQKHYGTLRYEDSQENLRGILDTLACADLVPQVRDGNFLYTLLTNGEEDVVLVTQYRGHGDPAAELIR